MSKQKTVCILGGHGFICHHIARRLKKEGWWVRTVDIAEYSYGERDFTDDYVIGDLRNPLIVSKVLFNDKHGFSGHQTSLSDKENSFDLVIQGAADMGGMEFLAGGNNDADVMHNSALINLNVAHYAALNNVKKLYYCSSACIYPLELQGDSNNVGLKESDSIPAHPDLCYGWEKLFSEILYDAFNRNYKLDIAIGRFHNIYGIEGTYEGIRAKAPAAICRKVAEAVDGGEIEIWGTGEATRSFLEVDECVEGVLRLIENGYNKPLNIGSDEMVSINQLAKMVIKISGKKLTIKNIDNGLVGVMGRNSENTLIEKTLNWRPVEKLEKGMTKLYNWILSEVNKNKI